MNLRVFASYFSLIAIRCIICHYTFRICEPELKAVWYLFKFQWEIRFFFNLHYLHNGRQFQSTNVSLLRLDLTEQVSASERKTHNKTQIDESEGEDQVNSTAQCYSAPNKTRHVQCTHARANALQLKESHYRMPRIFHHLTNRMRFITICIFSRHEHGEVHETGETSRDNLMVTYFNHCICWQTKII